MEANERKKEEKRSGMYGEDCGFEQRFARKGHSFDGEKPLVAGWMSFCSFPCSNLIASLFLTPSPPLPLPHHG